MKSGKILMALCVAIVVSIFIFGTTIGFVYAKAGIDNTDAASGTKKIEDQMPPTGNVDPNGKGPDKGSPMHAWKAIVNSGKKVGDIITTKEFETMRNWSSSTRGYELQSLVAIGVLAPTGNKGEYRLLIDATTGQIDEINQNVVSIVDRKGIRGENLGIDSFRLDAAYLGNGDIASGNEKLNGIRKTIAGVIGQEVNTQPNISDDFVAEEGAVNGKISASAAINSTMQTKINGTPIQDSALLAGLINTRIVSPEAIVRPGNVADFSAAKVKTVMFKEELLDNPSEFTVEFNKLAQDETAVIVAINKNNGDIKAALEKAGLLGQWGNRIVVMGVSPNSPAALAFGRLFGSNSIIDLRGQAINNILESKDLVEGLKGAV